MIFTLAFLIIPFTVVLSQDSSLPIAGTNDKCAEFCSKTYAAHTNENSGAEEKCKQGCRFHSILQFANKMNPGMAGRVPTVDDEQANANLTEDCRKQCDEAYSDQVYADACKDGCMHQLSNGPFRVIIDDSSPAFPFTKKLIDDAFGKFKDMQESMKAHLENFKNWFNSDDSYVSQLTGSEKSQTPTETGTPLQRITDNFFKLLGIGDQDQSPAAEKKQHLLGGPEDVGDRLPNHGQDQEPNIYTSRPKHIKEDPVLQTVGNSDENGEPIILVKMIPETGNEEGQTSDGTPLMPIDVVYADADDGWLACLARRTQNLSLLSRWLLCAALMLSILCMLLLCLTFVRSQRLRRRRLYMQYRAGKSDLIYFMPPPAYEKMPTSAAYVPLNKEEKSLSIPPPSYKDIVENEEKKEDA